MNSMVPVFKALKKLKDKGRMMKLKKFLTQLGTVLKKTLLNETKVLFLKKVSRDYYRDGF